MRLNILKAKDQHALETFVDPDVSGRRIYGALPFFSRRDVIIQYLAREEDFFAKFGQNKRIKAKTAYREALALYEMKFGVRLSVFAKEVLRHYPSLRKKGKILNIFGLSGSGKSTVYQLLRPMLGTRGVVCIDDDAARYGLFAKPIFDLETNAGTSLGEIRQHLLHNAISDTFYILLDFLTQELRSRGYVVIRTSTIPLGFADQLWYVEHPDGVDPRVLRDDDVVDAVKKLVERTSARTAERDTYPWKKARRVLEFSQMLSVDLRLSERPHTKILQSLIRAFRDRSLVKRVQVIRNLPITDVRQRRQMFVHQLRDLLKK